MPDFLTLKKQLDSLGLTFDRTQSRESSSAQPASSSPTSWESRAAHLRKPFCTQDGFCKDHANFVGVDEIGPVIVSTFWEDIDQSDAWLERKNTFTAFVRTAKGFSEVTLARADHEALAARKRVPPQTFLVLILEKYLSVMGLGSLNAATLAANLHVATDLGLCHALRRIDLEHLLYGAAEFDVVFAEDEDRVRRLLGQGVAASAPAKSTAEALGVESKKANPEKKRKIEMELLETERNYVRQLELVDEKYNRELRLNAASSNAFITPEEVRSMFFSLEKLLEVNRPFLADLESVLNPPKTKLFAHQELRTVEQVILKHAQAFEHYAPFVNNYEASSRTLQTVQERSPAFRAFLLSSRMLPGSDRMDLNDLLITPIQRIPRYVLLLKDILKNTSPQDPLYEEMKEATLKMAKMAGHIDEMKSKTEGRLKLFELAKEIEDCPPTLLSANRTYVSHLDVMEYDELTGASRGKYRTIYLFNDRLLLAKRKTKGLGSVRKFRHKFDSLEDLSLVSLEHYGLSESKAYLIALEVAPAPSERRDTKDREKDKDKDKKDGGGRKYVLGTSNLEELTSFVKQFMLTQAKNNSADSKHKFVRCTAKKQTVQFNLLRASDVPKHVAAKRRVVSLAFCSEDSQADVLSKAFTNCYVAILVVSLRQGGVRCVVKTRDNLGYFGPDISGSFVAGAPDLAELLVEKVMEAQRVALDESASLHLVHDKHCAELAKAIVTAQIVNDKVTRLASLRRFKSITGTPMKSFALTPSSSKPDSPHVLQEKPLVNRVALQLVQAIEQRGLAVASELYATILPAEQGAVQGVLAAIESSKAEVPADTLQALSLAELCSLLVHFLRLTCGVLFPATFEQRVEQAAALENPKDTRAKLREAAQNLPPAGSYVLRIVLEHVDKVQKVSQDARVDETLVQAFAPLVFSHRGDTEDACDLLRVLVDLMSAIYEAPKPRLSISLSSTSLFSNSLPSPVESVGPGVGETPSRKRKSIARDNSGEDAENRENRPAAAATSLLSRASSIISGGNGGGSPDVGPKKLRMSAASTENLNAEASSSSPASSDGTPTSATSATAAAPPATVAAVCAAPATCGGGAEEQRRALEAELGRLKESNAKDRETKIRIVALRRQLQELTTQLAN